MSINNTNSMNNGYNYNAMWFGLRKQCFLIQLQKVKSWIYQS